LLNKYIESANKIDEDFIQHSSNLQTLGLNIAAINILNKNLFINKIKEYINR